MILVCIYGPAASGKLTIAREVGAKTGIPVFHNHLVVDMLVPVFGFGAPPFVELRERAMLDVIGRAAEEGLPGLLFTFTPERTVRHRFIGDLNEKVAAASGKVVYVGLTCPEEELERRMENPSRAEFGKIHSLAQYRRVRYSGGFEYPSIPNTRLTIDTSTMEPSDSAARIIQLLGLPSH